MAMELKPLGTMTLTMQPPTVMPNSPAGTRIIVEFSQIELKGERLNAKLKGTAAGDWLRVGPEGTATLDFRFCLETQDGAVIFVQAAGRADSAGFAKGAPTYIAPTFETSDARYAWLNRVQAVGRGHASGQTVTFEICEVR